MVSLYHEGIGSVYRRMDRGRREREWCGVIWRIGGGIGETVVSGVSTEYRIIIRTLATFL